MHILSTAEMRRLEAESDAAGHTYADMMRLAGAAVAAAVEEASGTGDTVVVLCGPGNNGGDGLVTAGLLRQAGCDVRVLLWQRTPGEALSGVAEQLGDAPQVRVGDDGARDTLAAWLAEADVVVDALLGTGISRPIEGSLAEVLDAVAGAVGRPDGPIVVAVDVPTGLDSDSGAVDPHTVPADLTVTFGFPKRGQLRFPGAGCLGEMVVDGIGIDSRLAAGALYMTTAAEVLDLLPDRPLDGHKGTFGRALVVAGSVNFTGAAFLAAAAAYRAGCGLVTAAVPGSLQPVIATLVPEATFLILSEDLGVIARPAATVVHEAWGAYDAVLIGPGLTTQHPAAEFLRALLAPPGVTPAPPLGFGAGSQLGPATEPSAGGERGPVGFAAADAAAKASTLPRGGASATGEDAAGEHGAGEDAAGEDARAAHAHAVRPTAMVVDADGLNLLARVDGGLGWLPPSSVLTPHPGEMARLTGRSVAAIEADRVAAASAAAAAWGHVVVLKGALTVIAAPDGRVHINPFANPALAKGGTGDVLAGIIVGLRAQGLDAYDAAVCAAYIHALAGELAADAVGGRGATAVDVLDEVAAALVRLEDEAAG